MTRTILAVAALASMAGTAGAQPRPDATLIPCRASAGLVQSRGAVVLGTGGATYDRFVANRSFCESQQYARPAFVPARDTPSCFVGYRCRDWERDTFDY